MDLTDKQKKRFNLYVERPNADGCMLWSRCINGCGYGSFFASGKVHLTHRLAFILHTGENHRDKLVCHTPFICKSRACCNPSHLRWGTSSDNVADSVKEGTHNFLKAVGERNHKSKLNAHQVCKIRDMSDMGTSHRSLASMYGVTHSTVSRIVNRTTWRHLG